ncbi:MAG: type 3 dihydrofolate reductase [Pseudomonadota bacterium]
MQLSIIVAMDANRVIGHENRLPWHLPADLRHFREITMGKPIVMGRRTWESIGRPLPGRANIVITRDRSFTAAGCVVVHSVSEALAAAAGYAEVMLIGGAQLYRQLLPRADRLYITQVDGEFPGDAWFPELDPAEWREVARSDHAPDDKNAHGLHFITLERIAP